MSRMIEPFGITVEINTDIDLVPNSYNFIPF